MFYFFKFIKIMLIMIDSLWAGTKNLILNKCFDHLTSYFCNEHILLLFVINEDNLFVLCCLSPHLEEIEKILFNNETVTIFFMYDKIKEPYIVIILLFEFEVVS